MSTGVEVPAGAGHPPTAHLRCRYIQTIGHLRDAGKTGQSAKGAFQMPVRYHWKADRIST